MSILEQFFKPREAPALPMPEAEYSARDWYAHLFSQKRALEHRGTEKTGNPSINLLGHLLSNQTIFQSTNPDVPYDRRDVEHLVMREVTAERAKITTSDSTGELCFAYAEQIMGDLEFFKGIYLGTVTPEEIADKLRFQQKETPVAEPTLHASPTHFDAADSLLEYLPELDCTNPPVASIKDMRYLVAAHLMHRVTKDPQAQEPMVAVFVKPEVKPETKLIYNTLLFYMSFVQEVANTVRGIK